MTMPPASAPIRVALLGAAGLAGEAVVRALEERKFPVAELTLLGGGKALGRTLEFHGAAVGVAELKGFDFSSVDLVISLASAKVSAEWLPHAREAGCAVIDASPASRGLVGVPLVVPGVNDAALLTADGRSHPWVAVGSAYAAPLAQVLGRLLTLGDLQSVDTTVLAAVSGAGRGAVEELASQTARMLNGMDAGTARLLPRRMAFNVFPEVEPLDEDGMAAPEQMLAGELQALLGLPELAVHATCVRVPVFFGHSWCVRVSRPRSLQRPPRPPSPGSKVWYCRKTRLPDIRRPSRRRRMTMGYI
jgi:aspartate-semialdehyde dehydrogenase